jgi:DNA polymerase III alpha subunit
VKYAHDELAEVLEPTYGVIVYQEQVMRIAQILAGLTLAEADVLRKAVGKKDADLIARELGKFVEKAVEKGHERRVIQDLADQIEAFGRYGFNKSHSAAYGLLSYQTAWLKCHYPAEFMAALMSSVVDKIVLEALIASGRAGRVRAEDGGRSPAPGRAGRRLRRGAGRSSRERESSQDELLRRSAGRPGPRPGWRCSTQPALPGVEKWSETERLAREKEILGFFISGHPLNRYREDVALFEARTNTQNLKSQKDTKIELACVVTEAARQVSKKDGSEWGRITVEDFHGTATVLAFGESWAKYREVLQQDAPVVVRGAVSGRDRDEEDPPVFLDGAVPSGPELRAGGRRRCRRSSSAPTVRRRPRLESAEGASSRSTRAPGRSWSSGSNGGTEETRLAVEARSEGHGTRRVAGPRCARLLGDRSGCGCIAIRRRW